MLSGSMALKKKRNVGCFYARCWDEKEPGIKFYQKVSRQTP